MSSSLRSAAVVLVGLALAGCAAMPTSGPVEQHEFGGEPENSSVLVAPVPPAPGATPMLVVEGFLHAMGTDQGDFPIARQYLTESAATRWDPAAGTTVYADGTPPQETENSVVLSVPVIGTLNTRGEFREGSGRISQDFQLVRGTDDQWRISRPPDGLLISRYDLTYNYTAVDLHFLDVTQTALVPDRRYFALNSSTLLNVARVQLASPGWWLAPAVRPALSGGIEVERVDLDADGVAEVHLTSAAMALEADQRRNILAELTWTLTELPEVTGVQVFSGSTQLVPSGVAATVLTRDVFGRIAPVDPASGRLFAGSAGRVLDVNNASTWAQATAVAPSITDAGSFAVRADQLQLAVVNAGGTRLSTAALTGDTAAVTVLEGTGLLRPAYSRQQELWAIGNGDDPSGFRVFSGLANVPLNFWTDSLPTDPVVAFRISPDGTRMALVVRGADFDQVGVARIVRGSEGVRLQQFRAVSVITPPEAGMRLLDVGWDTSTRLLVLVAHADADKTVSAMRVEQDSSTADEIGPNQVAGLKELAVVPSVAAVVRGEDAVYRYESEFNWKIAATGVEAIAYSG